MTKSPQKSETSLLTGLAERSRISKLGSRLWRSASKNQAKTPARLIYPKSGTNYSAMRTVTLPSPRQCLPYVADLRSFHAPGLRVSGITSSTSLSQDGLICFGT